MKSSALTTLLAPLLLAGALLGVSSNAVAQTDTAPDFGTATITDQNYIVGQAIIALTLPAAMGGNGALTYALAPAIPGLTFDPTRRVMTGTPTTAAVETDYAYTATDEDDDIATLTFTITVVTDTDANTTPVLRRIPMPTNFVEYTRYQFTIRATDADSPKQRLTYSLAPNPYGATILGGIGTTGGTPSDVGQFFWTTREADGGQTRTFTVTVTDDGTPPLSDTRDFSIPVMELANRDPTGAILTVAGDATSVTNPKTLGLSASATDPDTGDTLTYTWSSDATGDTFVLATGASTTWTPPTVTTATMVTLTVTITDTTDGSVTAMQNVTVNPAPPDTEPSFGTATIDDQSYIVGQAITPLTLPAAPGGNDPTTYTLTPAWPTGLNFDPTTRALSGTPNTAAPETEYTYTATDEDDDDVTLTFNITVVADTAPFFTMAPPSQTYIVNAAIMPVTLPAAMGGNGALTYTLATPPGLTFNPATRVLSGTPTTLTDPRTFIYTASDSDGNTAAGDQIMLGVFISVKNLATRIVLSVRDVESRMPISVVREGSMRDIRVVVTTGGEIFTVDQEVTFTVTPPLASRPDSASTPYVAYTAVEPITMTIPRSSSNIRFVFSLMTVDDAFDHADFPLTMTATAQPSGFTTTYTMATLEDNDISITTSATTAAVVAGATATYDVQLSEQPPADTTVTVASQGTGTATVSPATLAFTTGNWNTARTVTVTGVAVGGTTIRHTAPAIGDFSFVTNDVAVTVAAAPVAPVFTNAAAFTSPIEVAEHQTAVGADNFFDAPGTAPVTLTLGGADMALFSITPDGTLTFNDAPDFEMPRGAPITGTNTNDYALTVTAMNSVDSVASGAITVRVTDEEEAPDIVPTFSGMTVPRLIYRLGETVAQTMPVANGGNGDVTYTLSGPLPAGLTFDPATRVLSGTLTAAAATDTTETFIYTATDADDDTATLTITIIVLGTDIAPSFGSVPLSIPSQSYLVNTEIKPLTLPPVATHGNGPTTYMLATPPPGLTFNPVTRILSGTPTTVAPAGVSFAYTASDSDGNTAAGDQDTRDIFISVRELVTRINLLVRDVTDGNLPISVVQEGSTRRLRVVAVPVPSGGIFAVDQQVTLTVTPPAPASRPDNASDPYVAYTEVEPITVLLPRGRTNATFEFSLETVDDAFDHADFPLTMTATMEPSGFTDMHTTTRLGDNDIRITTSVASASAAVGATAIYNVQLSEAPPATTTVTVASLVVGTATVSPATLIFTTTNWNTARVVTVTGVAEGSTTIRHSAPDNAGFSFITNDVAVTGIPEGATAPVFTTPPATALTVAEGNVMAGTANVFAATATGTVVLTLSGTDGARFSITPGGTLTFNAAPDFEMPRGMAFDADTNINDYMLTVTATADGLSTDLPVTLRVTDANDAPVLNTIPTLSTFVEYTEKGFSISATDEDSPAQALTYVLAPNAFGAIIEPVTISGLTGAAQFIWTPREEDGGEARQFSVTVTDDGNPPRSDTRDFTLTAEELPNRAPTGATITAADGAMTVANPNTLGLSATATDPDTGDMLTYTWSSSVVADTFAPATGAGTTWTPATVMSATTTVLTVTVSDDATPPLTTTATHTVTVNPPAVTGTLPTSFTLALNPTVVTESDTATHITATVTFVGGTFTVARVVSVATQGGVATAGTDYTTVSGANLTIPANMASGTVTIPFTAAVDTVADSGETVNFVASLRTADGMGVESAFPTATATLTINNPVTVTDTAPTFGGTVPPTTDLTFRMGQVVAHNLPTATGGEAPLTYRLSGTLPAGLTFNGTASPPTLTGTPTAAAAAGVYTYTVQDADEDTDTRAFRISVAAVAVDTFPTFGGRTIDAQTYIAGLMIEPLTLPQATGGEAPLTYTLAPALPDGLTFDATARTITGMFTDVATVRTFTYTVADGDMNTDAADAATLMFSITVVENEVPTFRVSGIPTRSYEQGQEIPPLTLLVAVGGNGDGDAPITYTYSLVGDLPAGLTFNAATRVLSGTPTTVAAAVTMTYTVHDGDHDRTPGDADTLSLTITITGDPITTGPALERNMALTEMILPEVARALVTSTTSSIAQRIEQATATDDEDATLTVNGRALSLTDMANAGSLADALNSPGMSETLTAAARGLSDGSWQSAQMFGNSSFVLPLNAGGPGVNRLMLWGRGDYRNVSGKSGGVDWDGDLISGRLGADAQVTDTLLAGLAVSRQSGSFDYTSADTIRGTYNIDQTSIHPYLGWSAPDGRRDAWITLGYGWGEVEIDHRRADGPQTADLTTSTIGGGGSAMMLEAGMGTLRLKGEILQTRADVEGNADEIVEMSVDARRMRLTVEGARELVLANGASLRPTVEVGVRHDAGNGRTGTGAEIGGSLRFTHPAQRLMLEGRWRALLSHTGGYEDWGISGMLRFEPGANGRGLAVSLQPSYGATASRVAALWAQETAVGTTASAATPRDSRMNVTVSYGMDWADGMVTPYSRLLLTDTQTQAYRIGSRLQMSDGLALDLEGLRQQTATQPVDHGILLKLQLDW